MAARILMLVVAATILLVIIRLVGRRQLRSKYALLWLFIGLVSLPLAVVPSIADSIADWMGIESTSSLLLMLASATLLLIVIHYSWELSRLEERSRRLAEELALLAARIENRPTPADMDHDDA